MKKSTRVMVVRVAGSGRACQPRRPALGFRTFRPAVVPWAAIHEPINPWFAAKDCMTTFTAELLKRFPEIAGLAFEGDDELPYLMVSHLVEWLKGKCVGGCDEATAQRLVEFWKWVIAQPRGASASDDILTIVTVSLYEKLFTHEELVGLVPRLVSRQDVERNKPYLLAWVGQDNYDRALREFTTAEGKSTRRTAPRHSCKRTTRKTGNRRSGDGASREVGYD